MNRKKLISTVKLEENSYSDGVDNIYRITLRHDITAGPYIDHDDDTELNRLLSLFRNKNPHLFIVSSEKWSDGDGSWTPGDPGSGNMVNYITIFFEFAPWFIKSFNNPVVILENGKKYKQFLNWTHRMIDVETCETFNYDPLTRKILGRW